MAAKILVQIEKMEQQQENILSSAAKENKQVLAALQTGIKDNQETIQTNMVMLRLKMGIKPESKSWKTVVYNLNIFNNKLILNLNHSFLIFKFNGTTIQLV